MSPVAVSFKLRQFKCKIADKKKTKVKLIAEIDMNSNRNLYSLRMFNFKLGVNNGQNMIDQLMTRMTDYLGGYL